MEVLVCECPKGQVMFDKLTHNGRIWVLLLAWVIFVGLSSADAFDLSDDILMPAMLGQAIVEADSDEFKSGMCLFPALGGPSFLAVMSGAESFPRVFSVSSPPISDPPLYQRLSTYRI